MSDISSNSQKQQATGSMYETPKALEKGQQADLDKVPRLDLGFKKATLDPALYKRLYNHYLANLQNFKSEKGEVFIQTENERCFPSLLYQDDAFNHQLMDDLMPAHAEWSGLELVKAACYGIRVYQPRSYLYNHVDRARTHIVSSTICVDRRLNSPWPLYIEDHDGKAHEVSIEPGEMVFFEGARLKHGPPLSARWRILRKHFCPLHSQGVEFG